MCSGPNGSIKSQPQKGKDTPHSKDGIRTDWRLPATAFTPLLSGTKAAKKGFTFTSNATEAIPNLTSICRFHHLHKMTMVIHFIPPTSFSLPTYIINLQIFHKVTTASQQVFELSIVNDSSTLRWPGNTKFGEKAPKNFHASQGGRTK